MLLEFLFCQPIPVCSKLFSCPTKGFTHSDRFTLLLKSLQAFKNNPTFTCRPFKKTNIFSPHLRFVTEDGFHDNTHDPQQDVQVVASSFAARLFFFLLTLTCTSFSERPLTSSVHSGGRFFFFFFFSTTFSFICPYSNEVSTAVEGRRYSMDTAASFILVSISLSLSLQQINVSPDMKTRTTNFLSWRTEGEPGAGNRRTPRGSHGFSSSLSWDRSRKQAEAYKKSVKF